MRTLFKQTYWCKALFCLLFLNFILPTDSIFRTDAYGQGGPLKLWTKQFGGFDHEHVSSCVETSDGGYLLGATSASQPGKNKTAPNKGLSDYWVVKIDKNGNKMWDKTFGGSDADELRQIIKTKDGNFLLAGYSHSGKSSDKSEESKGHGDYWIVKISPAGIKLWDKTIGGNAFDYFLEVIENVDGTLLLAGSSGSEVSGDRTDFSRGGMDIWIVKTTSNGTKIWDKAYGGLPTVGDYPGTENLRNIKAAPDGGFYLAALSESDKGYDKSEDAFVSDPSSLSRLDVWVLKIDGNGTKIWDKTIGGVKDDQVNTVELWEGNKIFINGWSISPISGNKTVGPPAGTDTFAPSHYWFISMDLNGNILNQTFSFSKHTYIAAPDGYYVMARLEREYYISNLEKYNWANQRLWRKRIYIPYENFPNPPVITPTGHIMMAYMANVDPINYDQDFFIEKYDNKLYNPNPSNIYKAINLNSSIASLTVDNVPYVGSKVATNFTYTGRAYENQTLPLGPMPDANKAKMLRSTIYSTKTTPSAFNFLNVPNGNYEVFIYVWEDNFSSTYSIDVDGQEFAVEYESGPKGTWERLGPFRIAVTDGQINISGYGGDGNISGIAVYKYYGTMPTALATSSSETSKEVNVNKTGIKAFPNSISNELRLSFDQKTEGNANVTLLDMTGNVLQRVETRVQHNSALINLDSDRLKPGIYLLKVKTSRGEKVIRLHKK